MPRRSTDSEGTARRPSSRARPSSRQGSHRSRDSLDSDLDSTSSSDRSQSHGRLRDEEERIGSISKKQSWTMRALPSGAPKPKSSAKKSGGSYKPVPGDDSPVTSASEDEKPTKKTSTAAAVQSGSSPKTKIAWVLLGLVIVLIIVGGIGAWYYTKHESTSPDENSNSTSALSAMSGLLSSTSSDLSAMTSSGHVSLTGSATVTSALSSNASATASPSISASTDSHATMTATSAASEKSSEESKHDATGSTAATASTTHTSKTKETSSSAKESATSDAATSTATTEPKKYETAVTYFDAVDEVGPCGTKPTDEDEVIHVPAIVWGDDSTSSPWCGRWLTIWWPDSDQTVRGTVQGLCEACDSKTIDVSKGLFAALTKGQADVGKISDSAQFWITPAEADGTYPTDGLTTTKATPTPVSS